MLTLQQDIEKPGHTPGLFCQELTIATGYRFAGNVLLTRISILEFRAAQ